MPVGHDWNGDWSAYRSIPSQSRYVWVRSRGHRHRQAHCLILDSAYGRDRDCLGFLRTACMMHIMVEELLDYKKYAETPERTCTSCRYWENRNYLDGLAK